jgi:O-antigen ligase
MPMLETMRQSAGRINSWLLPMLALSLPLSTTAVSILAVLIFLFWLAEGQFSRKREEIFANYVCVAILLYVALHAAGLLWSQDKDAGLDVLSGQWKLLLMPVFLTLVQPGNRRRIIFFYLAGLVAAMLVIYLVWFDLLQLKGVSPEHPTRKVFHVVYNPMLAFGFYLAMHEIIWGKASRHWKWALGAAALAMAWNMFITEGRAGQAGFFLLSALLVLQHFRKNIIAGLLVAALLLPLIFSGAYTFSPTFQKRFETAKYEVTAFGTDSATSIGMRLQFWQNSWRIIVDNPVFGVGTGDFGVEYGKVNMEASPHIVATDNPHNQYILVLCQFGIFGMAILLGIFIVQIWLSSGSTDQLKRIRLAFPLFFLLIMISESYLVVFETGFLFSLFSAVLYKGEFETDTQSVLPS